MNEIYQKFTLFITENGYKVEMKIRVLYRYGKTRVTSCELRVASYELKA